ncbi:hypothetical protein [Vitiosangium sp. GDMCC 1.1324]|uniref:hypothetical protein n=1 Tax=Vitiosangium sp. (strain GDMCC 1.1324) TaxID=2138576 RepID=UPI000D336AFE|nr:hypothetical protein [Vitiosangium sp. GDMCC 1.1324]PTL85909.1 hypothetical protein DAT35_04260 [Vitiosangium sp. GDMCC 1.1324]
MRNSIDKLALHTLAVLLLAMGAQPAWAQQKQVKTVSPSASIPGETYWQYTLEEGSSWQLVQSSGYAVDDDGRYFSERMYMIQDVNGLYNAPLPAGVREDLLSSVDATSTAFVLSETIVNEIAISEQQGWLTPALQAIAEPDDIGEPLPIAPSSGMSRLGLFGKCSDKVVSKNKSFNYSTPLNTNFNIGGGFSGNLSLTGDAQTSASGEVQVNLKRYKIFGICIPYGVKFDHARAYGTVMVNTGTTLSGTVNYASPGNWEWQIAKPHLFGFTFFIGPIPVYVGFNLPITAGLELKASVTGSVTYSASEAASGYFDYSCTLDSCGGYANISTSSSPQTFTGSVSGRIQPTVYAQVGFRGYLYSDSFAYAQVGVRPYLYGDLWGYYGNNCGDANGDGYYETVDALTFDLDWQIYITAQADTFLTSEKRWNLWNTARWHINYWDLIGSDALQPMLVGAGSVPVNFSQGYTARMRPCWPYTDNVNYQLAWGDGTTSYPSGAATGTAVSHSWSSTGTKGLTLTAVSDAHGRVFNASTARNIQVTQGGATHLGLTWKVLGTNGSYVHVGNDSLSNVYSGDTSPSVSLPILCLKKDNRTAPSYITFDFYNGWAGGEVRLTGPVAGTSLTSRSAADAICAGTFGTGFRMAEFHDGNGGWTWWAQGVISSASRFWVAINDQPANPWN